MTSSTDSIRTAWERASDAELRQALFAYPHEYDDATLAVMRAVAEERGLHLPTTDAEVHRVKIAAGMEPDLYRVARYHRALARLIATFVAVIGIGLTLFCAGMAETVLPLTLGLGSLGLVLIVVMAVTAARLRRALGKNVALLVSSLLLFGPLVVGIFLVVPTLDCARAVLEEAGVKMGVFGVTNDALAELRQQQMGPALDAAT
jgi:hypothetical protein